MNTKSERESLAASTTVIQSSPLLHLSDGQDPVPAETARKQKGQARGAVGESKQAGWESRQVLVGRSQVPGARQAGRQALWADRQAHPHVNGQSVYQAASGSMKQASKLSAAMRERECECERLPSLSQSQAHSSLTLSSPNLSRPEAAAVPPVCAPQQYHHPSVAVRIALMKLTFKL